MADLREIQTTHAVTSQREEPLRELDERLNTEADAMQELITYHRESVGSAKPR